LGTITLEVIVMAFEQGDSVNNLSPEVRQQAVEAARPAAALMDRATSHHSQSMSYGSDHGGNREAMMHTQGAPDRSQEALSPTDGGKSQTQVQQRSMDRTRSIDR
jgi:hypothetical protein